LQNFAANIAAQLWCVACFCVINCCMDWGLEMFPAVRTASLYISSIGTAIARLLLRLI